MKLFKKVAILLAVIASMSLCVVEASAQEKPQQANKIVKSENGVTVTKKRSQNGTIELTVDMDKDSTLSCEKAFKRLIASTISTLSGEKFRKAFSAIWAMVKNEIPDISAPMASPISVKVSLHPTSEDEIVASSKFDVDGMSYATDTKTTFNPDGSANTTGNLVKTDVQGNVAPAAPSNIEMATDGSFSGDVGGKSINEPSEAKTVAEALTTPTSEMNSAGSNESSDPIPDPTVVATSTQAK